MDKIKSCPLCGSTIVLDEMAESIDCIKTQVRCVGCGMIYTYRQEFAYSKVARVALNDSFEDIWNRTRHIERETVQQKIGGCGNG